MARRAALLLLASRATLALPSARARPRPHSARAALPKDEDKREEEPAEETSVEQRWRDAPAEELPWFCARDASRFTLFPLRDEGLWSMRKAARKPRTKGRRGRRPASTAP